MPASVNRDTVKRPACPVCGGSLIDVHCVSQCSRCHTTIDTCCEGIRPAPASVASSEASGNSPGQTSERSCGHDGERRASKP